MLPKNFTRARKMRKNIRGHATLFGCICGLLTATTLRGRPSASSTVSSARGTYRPGVAVNPRRSSTRLAVLGMFAGKHSGQSRRSAFPLILVLSLPRRRYGSTTRKDYSGPTLTDGARCRARAVAAFRTLRIERRLRQVRDGTRTQFLRTFARQLWRPASVTVPAHQTLPYRARFALCAGMTPARSNTRYG